MTDDNSQGDTGPSLTVVIGAAVIAPLLLFQVLLLIVVRGDNLAWGIVILIPLLLTAGYGLYALVVTYWHIRSDSDLYYDAIRVALLLTVPVSLVVTQFFAGAHCFCGIRAYLHLLLGPRNQICGRLGISTSGRR